MIANSKRVATASRATRFDMAVTLTDGRTDGRDGRLQDLRENLTSHMRRPLWISTMWSGVQA